jgi:hypothetical protein
MSWKPWQVWAYVVWATLMLVLSALSLAGLIPSSVLWPFIIVGGLIAGIHVIRDHLARQRILNQGSD